MASEAAVVEVEGEKSDSGTLGKDSLAGTLEEMESVSGTTLALVVEIAGETEEVDGALEDVTPVVTAG